MNWVGKRELEKGTERGNVRREKIDDGGGE